MQSLKLLRARVYLPIRYPNLILAALQDRQIQERAEIFKKHHTRIEKAKDELSIYYALSEHKRDIETLNIRLRKIGFLGRLFGRHRKMEAEKEEKLKTLSNAQMRFNEMIESLEMKRDRELEQLSHKQSEQVRKLTLELDAQFFEREHARRGVVEILIGILSRRHHAVRSRALRFHTLEQKICGHRR